MKTCCRCHQPKPYAAFSRNRNRPDGHEYYCKACRKTRTAEQERAYYAAHRETILAQRKLRRFTAVLAGVKR